MPSGLEGAPGPERPAHGKGGPGAMAGRVATGLRDPCGEQELEGELIGRMPTVRTPARMLHPVLQVHSLHGPGEVAAGA